MRNKSFFFTILLSCFVVVSQRVLAVTYYVSPSGDDSNPGTSTQSAWRTLDMVNTTDLNPGDTVLLEAGHDYPGNLLLTAEDTGTPTRPVVIGSYGSGRARIKAGNGSGVTVRNAEGVVVENLVVTGDDYRTNIGSGIKIVNELPNNQKLEYIRVHNVEASGFGRRNDEPPPPLGVEPLDGCGIFMGGYASDKSKSGYRDVRITNSVTYQNEYFGILTTGYWQDDPDTYANSHVYVGYCKAYDNPGDPNYFENHSGSGILVEDVDGGVIEYCQAYNNGYEGGCKVGGPIGIWTAIANNVIIQHCESHHNRAGTATGDGGGFDFDGGTTNSILQYNYSHDNDGVGYLIYSFENAPHTFNDNIVRYNISVNDGQKNNYRGGILVLTGSPKEDPIHNTQIYGNTIYSSISSAIFFGRRGIYNTKVYNNLFITANNQKLVEGNPDKSMATFSGNVYWAVDGKYDIAGYRSLEGWRAATGQEMLNGKPVGMLVDPKLIDLGNSDTIGDPTNLHTLTAYQLQKDSPLVDAGIELQSQFGINPGNRDFYGNPIPSCRGFDIGAHEIPCKDYQESPMSLNEAALMGDLGLVKSLLNEGANVNNRDGYYLKTPLQLATMSGHKDVVEVLITHGANVNTSGTTPLHYASERNNIEIPRLLIAKHSDVNTKNAVGDTPLHLAVRNNDSNIVELLIANGADVNARNNEGKRPVDDALLRNCKEVAELLITKGANVTIHVAARFGALASIRNLVKGGLDVNVKDEAGETALHCAVRNGHTNVVELLLDRGADVSSINRKGFTPIEVAMLRGYRSIVKLLVAKGVKVSIHIAAYLGDVDQVSRFIESGVHVDARDKIGLTPLAWAANTSVELVKLLVAKGAEVDAKDKWGWTPLDSAAYAGHVEIAELLIDKGVDVNSRYNWGETPLIWAAQGGHKAVAELLITRGADINTKDNQGRTALWYAQDKGHSEIVELLRKHGAKEDEAPEGDPKEEKPSDPNDVEVGEPNDVDIIGKAESSGKY